ncbi:MAG TPA: lysoplasmalogenase family protein, partial [Jatrophihabitans sp.]|nr:lysoplasmalogenase family protein [Jatrophihabitans sp.]
AGVLAAADWIAVGGQLRRLERTVKPLVPLALLASALTTPANDVRSWLVAALLCGALGDAALAFEPRPQPAVAGGSQRSSTAGESLPGPAAGSRQSPRGPLFLLGLAAFFLGHLCYLGALRATGLDQLSVVFGLLLVLVSLLSFGYRIIAGAHAAGGTGLTAAVTLCIVALGSVVVFGVGTAQLLIAPGVVLFALSDLILGYDRFVRPRSWGPLAIIVTYHLAQGLLVLGLLG